MFTVLNKHGKKGNFLFLILYIIINILIFISIFIFILNIIYF